MHDLTIITYVHENIVRSNPVTLLCFGNAYSDLLSISFAIPGLSLNPEGHIHVYNFTGRSFAVKTR